MCSHSFGECSSRETRRLTRSSQVSSGVRDGRGEPIPAASHDKRIQEFDANRRRYADEIQRMAEAFSRQHGVIEEGVYRFYYQSVKVSTLYATALQALDLFARLCPADCQINPWFAEIAEEAKRAWTSPPDMRARNANWTRHARPVVEFAFHCEYFLTQLVRYEAEEFASIAVLPSGGAAILYLYGLR